MTTPVRRITTLAAIGVVAFAIVAGGLWYLLWRPARHVDVELGFTIQFSPEWEVWPPGDGANARATRTIHGVNAVISVIASDVRNFPDSASYRDWWIEASSKGSGFARVQDGIRETPFGRLPWTLYIFRSQPGDIRMQALQYFHLRKGNGKEPDRAYIISCTATPDMFERFRPDFEETVDTFRADPVQTGSMTTAVP